ncbi:saccharopine dehydrogenase-like oxidoreductase [Rhagoletis pomonella]|uniref:saccharopine dehydrogenase-like oxidoreductase n=1 Tax=Rhagoletis pomonella TaxID=28610 RepID=UPI00178097BB|nr:saccharopine dehydrogenase-like oxidoreductase [Rhagoletis pomonella]
MGVVFAERNFPGTVNSIEMYWENSIDFKEGESKALMHAATWESVVHVFSHVKQLIALKQQLIPKDYPELKPALEVSSYPHKVPTLKSYFIPLKGGDGDIVANTQRLWFENEKKRPIQFQKYVGYKSLLYAILTPILVVLISLLSQLSFTRTLLLKNPKIFTLGLISSEGPTEAAMESHIFQLLVKTKGWTKEQSLSEQPKQQLWTRVSGRNPFYAMTGVTMLVAARIILQETHKLPGSGGVISPGYAFAKTSLIEELQTYKYGTKFEVLKLEP